MIIYYALFILFFFLVFPIISNIINNILIIIIPNRYSSQTILDYIALQVLYSLFFLRVMPRYLKKRIGTKNNYFKSIGFPLKDKRRKHIFIVILLGFFISLIIKYFNPAQINQNLMDYLIDLLSVGTEFILFNQFLMLFWLEILFRGVIFNIFLTKYSVKSSIMFSLFIQFSFELLINNFLTIFYSYPLIFSPYDVLYIMFPIIIQSILYIIYYRSGKNLFISTFASIIFSIFSSSYMPVF
jgi:membrane protease YdiL (CAAX protease family)